MMLRHLQFYALTSVVLAIVTGANAVIINSESDIQQIAVSITVQINSSISDGSGVIVAKQGNTYAVVTNNHVVCSSDNPRRCSDNVTYTVRTYRGKEYRILKVQRLQKTKNDPDLAIVTFNSSETYPVATLGNSDVAKPPASIYVYGFPSTRNRSGSEREPELSKGHITSRPQSRPGGYTLRYNAETWNGMSGGPVFDSDGRVIGIHGQGDREPSDAIDDQGYTTGQVSIGTGFNAAIPINTFLAMRSQIGQIAANLTIDNTPTTSRPVSLNNPNDALTYYVRGLSRLDMGDFSGSIADFNQALQKQPNYAEAYFYRGLARLQQRDLQGSIADYNQAIRLDPSYPEAYYNRAVVRSQLGDKAAAIADYTQAIRFDSTFAAAYNNRGLARSDLGDQQGAIDDFTQALQINPGKANTYYNRGLAHERLGNDRGALADYTQAIQINPNYAKAYGNRGLLLAQLGNVQGAIADLQQAAQLFRAQGKMEDYQKALDRIRQIQQQ
ncbi:MAG: tetratricopeptide repeat protein [Coleofasciculus sp.]